MRLDSSNEHFMELLFNDIVGIHKGKRTNIEKDDNFDESFIGQIEERGDSYTSLLTHYVKITVVRNWLKEICKYIFVIILLGSLIVISFSEWKLLLKLYKQVELGEFINIVPVFITAIAGFISTIISVPLVITKYLFNVNEDEYMTNIISHTQEHDLAGRKLIQNWKPTSGESHNTGRGRDMGDNARQQYESDKENVE